MFLLTYGSTQYNSKNIDRDEKSLCNSLKGVMFMANILNVTDDSFDEEVMDEKKPGMVDFGRLVRSL